MTIFWFLDRTGDSKVSWVSMLDDRVQLGVNVSFSLD